MNDFSNRNTRTHNTVVIILTVSAIGAVTESVAQNWEFWVPPLIIAGLIATWIFHVTQYRQQTFRENYYLTYAMMMAFYHGVHPTSFLDITVVSALLMVTVTLLRRREFLNILVGEFYILMITQIILAARTPGMVFDSLTISRILLHCIAELCVYKALSEVIKNNSADTTELEKVNAQRDAESTDTEDLLLNISQTVTPDVSKINGLSTVLLKDNAREALAIRTAGDRIHRTADDIRYYVMIRRGDVIIKEEDYKIRSLADDIARYCDEFIKRKDTAFETVTDADVPDVMRGDPGIIGTIIKHLLDNAFRFTKNGSVRLRISAVRHLQSVNLVIEVTDTGIGMSPQEIEEVSRGSYLNSRIRNKKDAGTGLGLPIVYGLVRLMKGFVSIESEKGKGTCVRISLPQQTAVPATGAARDNTGPEGGS